MSKGSSSQPQPDLLAGCLFAEFSIHLALLSLPKTKSKQEKNYRKHVNCGKYMGLEKEIRRSFAIPQETCFNVVYFRVKAVEWKMLLVDGAVVLLEAVE